MPGIYEFGENYIGYFKSKSILFCKFCPVGAPGFTIPWIRKPKVIAISIFATSSASSAVIDLLITFSSRIPL